MDKFEYKVRADEIKELISRGEYAQAADIADTIDWRRVKSVMMLCTISDLYKINRRYEDARDMLLLAYERRPGGRTICYSLCELSIKMEEFVQAVEYYKEFVQVAPKDPSRYILQYKLYEAQDVSLEERIAVLEELKKRDYREKWAYELAYLYHRVGLGARCVEECDELILWFGEGKYVVKAMELKMLHEPLTPQQQRRYMSRFATSTEERPYEEPVEEQVQEEVQQLYHQPRYEYQQQMDYPSQTAAEAAPEMMYGQTSVEPEATVPAQQPEEMDIQVKTMDMGQYNTINLQAELAAGLKEVLKSEQPSAYAEDPVMRSIMAPMMDSDTESLDYPEIDEVSEDDLEPDAGVIETSEVFFGETAEIGDLQQEPLKQEQLAPVETDDVAAVVDNVVEMLAMREEEEAEAEEAVVWDAIEEDAALQEVVAKESATVPDVTAEIVMEQLRQEITREPGGEEKPAPQPAVHVEPPKAYASVLSQESDGQLSLVMPESESIEKQITGQMSIEDILAEWERMKKENQEKRAAEVRQHVLQHTGSMFTEFEAAVRDGLLEKLEQQKDKGANIDIVVDSDSDEIEELEEIIDVQELEDEPAEQPASVVTEAFVNVVEEQEAAEEAVMAEEAAEEEPAAAEEPIAVEVESVMEQEQPAAEAEPIVTETAPAAAQEPVEEQPALTEQAPMPQTEEIVRDKVKVRSLTREEKELFGPYIQSRAAREQLAKCIDSISLASYTGNVIITGAEGMDTMTLAKNIIREIQLADPNFSGKVAKISGASLNHKSVADTIDRLKNGALIISRASDMNGETVMEMYKILQKENLGIVIVLEDIKKAMDKFLAENEQLQTCFTARMDVEPLSNDRLVAFGRQYAREREFSIDDLGILALHTRIEELQTLDHAVTVVEVTEIIEEAIRHVKRKTLGHFFDILFARRYDDEDMIILTEKDFV